MIKENLSFLSCAGSIETRESCFYKSPFNFSAEDKLLLKNSELRAELFKTVERLSLPIFIIEHDIYNSANDVDKFARYDSYILKLAVLIYSVRLKINEEGDFARFLWTSSEETFAFISSKDSEEVIDCLIRREISIRPFCDLSELMSGDWEHSRSESHHLMSQYLQLRYKHWRAA
ncbi:TPA: hypothetical protein L9K97_005099 [Klebsiella pneumoniae]|nr:hypothetical protein [Klebsiella pneumoniae]